MLLAPWSKSFLGKLSIHVLHMMLSFIFCLILGTAMQFKVYGKGLAFMGYEANRICKTWKQKPPKSTDLCLRRLHHSGRVLKSTRKGEFEKKGYFLSSVFYFGTGIYEQTDRDISPPDETSVVDFGLLLRLAVPGCLFFLTSL